MGHVPSGTSVWADLSKDGGEKLWERGSGQEIGARGAAEGVGQWHATCQTGACR